MTVYAVMYNHIIISPITALPEQFYSSYTTAILPIIIPVLLIQPFYNTPSPRPPVLKVIILKTHAVILQALLSTLKRFLYMLTSDCYKALTLEKMQNKHELKGNR